MTKKTSKLKNDKGISKSTSKKWHGNHETTFSINRYKNDMKLPVKYWNLKAENSNPKVTWAVKICLVCTTLNQRYVPFVFNEKLEMLEDKENNLLNIKSEVISKCCHQNKYMLWTRPLKIQYYEVT